MAASLRPTAGVRGVVRSSPPSRIPRRESVRGATTGSLRPATPLALRVGTTLRPASGTRPSIRPGRVPVIALVGDPRGELVAYVNALQTQGWQLVTFESAAEVFGSARTVDVAVVDVVLADGGGIDVLGYYALSHPGVRTVAFLGYAAHEAREAAIRTGAFAVLDGASPREVIDTIWRAFQDAELARERDQMADDLAHARRFAELGRMASWAAHELESPLHALTASLRMLEALTAFARASVDEATTVAEMAHVLGTQFDDVESVVAECRASAMRASRLARDLLVLTRSHDRDVVPVRVSDVFREAAASVPRASTMVSIRCDDECVLASEDQIVHVVASLLIHAVDGVRGVTHPRVEMLAAREGLAVSITVRHNGPGMTREQLARLFEPFHTPRAGTSGAGLALVAEMVRRMRGAIEATSAPGLGATFRVLLPCA